MAITGRDSLIAAVAAGQTIKFQKPTNTSAQSGRFCSLFRHVGMPSGGLAIPTTTGNTLSRTSTGAMPIPAPSGTSYISSFEATSANAQTLMLADRLVEFGGLSGTVTTAQAVSALALPARASGALDVELWLEFYTLAGTTAVATVTASYTNQSGTAGRTATLIGGIPASGTGQWQSYQFSLQAGDTGVQSVQSLTLGSTTGAAGNVGLVLRRSLVMGAIRGTSDAFAQGWAETDLTICPDDACIELMSIATSTNTGIIAGNFGIAQA